MGAARGPQVRCVRRGCPAVGRSTSAALSGQLSSGERGLFDLVDGELSAGFDGDPVGGIGTALAVGGWLPAGWGLVALAAVGSGGDRDQGAVVSEVVRVRLALLRRPGGGAGVPGLGERDQVVDVEGAGRAEEGVVVGRVPGPAGEMAAGALLGGDDGFARRTWSSGVVGAVDL